MAPVPAAEQVSSVRAMARHIHNERLSHAILELTEQPERVEKELALLTRVITKANQLIQTRPHDDLDNTNRLGILIPVPFSWRDHRELWKWTKSLLVTFPIMDKEIKRRYYNLPDAHAGAFEVFRFAELDGIARWVATNALKHRVKEKDRNLANDVINTICEATVILAEAGDSEAIELTTWMNSHAWLEVRWGFSENFFARSQIVAQNIE